jgi:hypothetical protein
MRWMAHGRSLAREPRELVAADLDQAHRSQSASAEGRQIAPPEAPCQPCSVLEHVIAHDSCPASPRKGDA